MKVVVVNESHLINKDIKIGDVCEVTDLIWNSSDSFHNVCVTKPDGSHFWYLKSAFKLLDEIREDKLNELFIK